MNKKSLILILLFLSIYANSEIKNSDYSNLTQAIIQKDIAKAKDLINSGANLNLYQNEDSVKKIVTPNIKTRYVTGVEEKVFPIIILAAVSGQDEIIKAIKLKDSSSIFLKDKYGNDALMWAAREGHASTVKLLLEYGFNPLYKSTKSKISAFDLAVNKNKIKVIELFVKKLIKENRTEKLSELIWSLSRKDEQGLIEKLLKLGIKDSYKAISPRTSLMKAADRGDIDTFNLLVKYGSNPYESNVSGKRINYDSLTYSIMSNKSDMIKYLLGNFDFDLSKKINGENYLHFAYRKYTYLNLEAFSLLIDKSKIDPNSLGKNNSTLLEKSVLFNDIKYVNFFITYILDKNVINKAMSLSKERIKSYEEQYTKVKNNYNLRNIKKSKRIYNLLLKNKVKNKI